MAGGLVPIRRVVTGNDERGKSRVLFDGTAPNAHQTSMGTGRGHTDLWVWEDAQPRFGTEDAGNRKYEFPCPPAGGHWRVVQSIGKPANYDAATDKDLIAPHAPKPRPTQPRAWDRGGNNAYSSAMHKTQTIDYAVLLEGERVLRLDDAEVVLKAGDVVVQVGAWHQWTSPRQGGRMAFDMFAADFVDGPAGVAQGNHAPLKPSTQPLPAGVTPARRVVTVDYTANKGSLVSDTASPDVRLDPARPGYALARMWATDSAPAMITAEALHLPYVLQPPARGSVLNVITFPPDANWRGKVGAAEVKAFFASVNAAGASTWAADAPHPYMQKMDTLDLCVVTQGEIVLVLDTQEVTLKAGDVVVQQGSNHAWSNRSGAPAAVAIASHGAAR